MLVILALLLLAGLAGALLYVRSAADRQLKQLVSSQRRERSDLLNRSAELYRKVQREGIERFSIPLSWAVRKELMKQNYEQIDDYFAELARKDSLMGIFLVDSLGLVKVASDRALLESSFSGRYPSIDFRQEKIAVSPLPDGKEAAVIPIMGLSEKLGTVVVILPTRQFPLEEVK